MTVPESPVIDPATLAARLVADSADSGTTVLDVRWRLTGPPGREEYSKGHIPGASFLDLDEELCGRPGAGGRHPLPDPASLQRALRRAGVRADGAVVVYDAGEGQAAARAWWTLRWAGHPHVRVLDGGYAAWAAAGYPVTTDTTAPVEGDVVVRPGGLPVLDAADASRLAVDGVLLDVRTPERFRGESEPVDPVAGRIPAAVNLPTGRHTGPDGKLRTPDELRATFAAVGVTVDAVDKPVGAYCGSGVTAAHTVLALHLAGRTDAALYVGSWSHWLTDPARPIATG